MNENEEINLGEGLMAQISSSNTINYSNFSMDDFAEAMNMLSTTNLRYVDPISYSEELSVVVNDGDYYWDILGKKPQTREEEIRNVRI